ncbi:MAG: rhomboid family intramembrane serine protease [Flavobacterium sp.]|nr:rhomboid family intramembrane serine protease [Flavobacterium sp.]
MNDKQHFTFTPSVWLVPGLLLVCMWMVWGVENIYRIDLAKHGINPRTFVGLQGVLFSPFLHANLQHLANNSIPLFVLGTALIYFYRELSLKVLWYGILFSGLLTWIFGRNSIHIGASSLVYVLVSFIFFKGLYTQYYRLMALSLTVVLVYGGMVWYVFPSPITTGELQISWEGHLAGLLVGLVMAIHYKTPDYIADMQYPWEKPDFNPEEDPFMKHFDEHGNFVNSPDTEVELPAHELQPSNPYVYLYKPSSEQEK